MSRGWVLTLLTGGVTMAIKSLGAVLPNRARSPELNRLLERLTPLLVPAVLGALVVVQVFSSGRRLTIDARVVGLLTAIVGVKLRASPAVVLVAAAMMTALGRLIYAQATGRMS